MVSRRSALFLRGNTVHGSKSRRAFARAFGNALTEFDQQFTLQVIFFCSSRSFRENRLPLFPIML